MDTKSKIFLAIFFTFIILITGLTFYKYIVAKDYYVKVEADCDPEIESCFVYECDPAEDTQCPEDPVARVYYYKIIEKKAYAIPLCDPNNMACPPLACNDGEDCTEIYCEQNIEEEVFCATPDTLVTTNPLVDLEKEQELPLENN